MQESQVQFQGQEDPLERDRLSTPVLLGFPRGSASKESACNVGDLGLIPGLETFPGEGKGYPLQYSALENFIYFKFIIVNILPWLSIKYFLKNSTDILKFILTHSGCYCTVSSKFLLCYSASY